MRPDEIELSQSEFQKPINSFQSKGSYIEEAPTENLAEWGIVRDGDRYRSLVSSSKLTKHYKSMGMTSNQAEVLAIYMLAADAAIKKHRHSIRNADIRPETRLQFAKAADDLRLKQAQTEILIAVFEGGSIKNEFNPIIQYFAEEVHKSIWVR